MMRTLVRTVLVAGVVAISSAAWGATRVVVLPFAGVSPSPTRDAWIAGAVQQSIIMSLGQSRGLQPVAAGGRITGIVDANVAARAAAANQGELAVFGTYEVVADQVRLSAQVVDSSGQNLGAARVTGSAEKLLSLEDDLSEQIRAAVANPLGAEPVRPAVAVAAPAAVPVNLNAAPWTSLDNSIYDSPYYTNYGYGYGYGLGYGYGYWPYRYLGYGYSYPLGCTFPLYSGFHIRIGACHPRSFGEVWERIHSGTHVGTRSGTHFGTHSGTHFGTRETFGNVNVNVGGRAPQTGAIQSSVRVDRVSTGATVWSRPVSNVVQVERSSVPPRSVRSSWFGTSGSMPRPNSSSSFSAPRSSPQTPAGMGARRR